MPKIYLSPSTQENNMYVTGGSEEYYMNLIADDMVPYLQSSGIQYTRNTKDMTAASSIRQSNSGNYGLHLAIHSNAAPEGQYGSYRGIDVYYSPKSPLGKKAAEIFVRNQSILCPTGCARSRQPPSGRLRKRARRQCFLRSGITTTEATPTGLREIFRELRKTWFCHSRNFSGFRSFPRQRRGEELFAYRPARSICAAARIFPRECMHQCRTALR